MISCECNMHYHLHDGTEFVSEFDEILLSHDIKKHPTTIKNPQSNVLIERAHLVIADSLRAMHFYLSLFDEMSVHATL